MTRTIDEILSGPNPERFFLSGEFRTDMRFSLFADMVGIPQPVRYHPEGDVFNHSVEVLAAVSLNTEKFDTRIAALLHDAGKVLTPKDIWPRHLGHDNEEAQSLAGVFLSQFPEVEINTIEFVKETIHYHMACKSFNEFKGSARRRMLRCIGVSNIEEFCLILRADHTSEDNINDIIAFTRENI